MAARNNEMLQEAARSLLLGVIKERNRTTPVRIDGHDTPANNPAIDGS